MTSLGSPNRPLAVLLLAASASASAQPPPGFTPLFDGTLGQATIENGGTFTIEGGVLRAEGSEGWLRFPPLVRDFRLRVELRFLTDNADSGVFFRALPDGAFARGWPNRSYQVQLLNPAAGGSLPPVGGLFRHGMPPGETTHDREAVRSAFTGTGEWQLLEVELRGAELTVQLNGVPVTRAAGIADVAGYIGIQSETSAVEFRRIDIEVIDSRADLTNPYERVDWTTFSHHRADLHVHTLQSDGCHHLEEVVRVYRAAGFSILSITDHDAMAPNACPTREATPAENIRFGFFTETPSPYPNPRPANFPAETTWPWNAFGAPSPTELGMVGIEGAELTCGHHINSYFNDYGVQPPCRDAPAINEWLHEVARRNGIAVINHPEPRFREWYIELYRYHSASHLVGIELSRGVDDATALWDQLLGDLMPSRPVWGSATSDMHFFKQTQFAFTVFVLDELTTEGVKEAMQAGQFYAVVGPDTMDLRESGQAAYDETYPELRSVSVDRNAAEISIDAANYDEIVWISKPTSGRLSIDAERGLSWPPGEVVQRGPVFNYSNADAALPYVRAELIRHTENGPIRLFLNPFALTPPSPGA